MGTAASPLNVLLDDFSRCLDGESARRVSEFHVQPATQHRIEVFAERANDGLLSEIEMEQYESLVNAADLISILKLKAQRQL